MFFNWATITALIGLGGWIIPVVMLFIVPGNRKPSSATAWLLLAFLLPYLGLVIFLLLGSPKLSKRRRAEQRTMDELLHKAMEEFRHQPELAILLILLFRRAMSHLSNSTRTWATCRHLQATLLNCSPSTIVSLSISLRTSITLRGSST
jgi:hypothetical protein